MEALYREYLTTWRVVTDDALFVHYTSASGWGQYGTFGAREYMGQALSEAPKERALLWYIAGGGE